MEEKQDVVQRPHSIWGPMSRVLFCCFHVGRYRPPGSQALEALVRVIDEDPVFVLVVSLRVVTCDHCWLKNIRLWELIEV